VAGIAELGRSSSANGRGGGTAKPTGWAQARIAGHETRMAVYERDRTPERFEGPAIVMEETATTLIPAGWAASRVAGGQILLKRLES
jgi:N-methylhydantoinase A/oxoprolinase/acetone carboxylase beta subunit